MFDHGIIAELPWMSAPYYPTDALSSEEVAQSYTPDLQEERFKPDLTEVIEPEQSLKLSDLKKKDLTYLEKLGPDQVQKPLK